jgi:hypothetical protein
MKDVASCVKPRGVAKQTLIRGFPLGTSEHPRATPVERCHRPRSVGCRQQCTARRKVKPIARTASRSYDTGVFRCEDPVRVVLPEGRFAGSRQGEVGTDRNSEAPANPGREAGSRKRVGGARVNPVQGSNRKP